MAGIGDILGEGGQLRQLLLYNVVGQVISALGTPAFTALTQDVNAQHPNVVVTPDVLARAVGQTFMSQAAAITEASKSGIDASRFDLLLKLAQVRIQPADLAEAVLRSYTSNAAAEKEAQLQGVTPDRFAIMTLLAGDGIGPQQAAEALRRKYIDASGVGPESTSYEQAIAESRLHNKWAPVLYQLTKAILSPADAADAVVRGFLAESDGITLAALNGVDANMFGTLVSMAADAPSPTQLAEALRRGVIPLDAGSASGVGFAQGIREGRLADKWIPMIQALAQEWPTPTDALEARLVGQITTPESKQLYAKFGGDPDYWDLLFHTRGESPTPLELGALANRGYIPWDGLGSDKTTFQQGFFEGRWRDKWEPVYKHLAKYVPPIGTVTTLLSRGSITDAQAAKYLTQQGMDETLVKAYIEDAHAMALGPYRGETISSVLKSYYEQILTADQVTPILASLHMTPLAIKLALEYQDQQRAFAALNSVVSRVRTLYSARKITAQIATAALVALGLPNDAITSMMDRWGIENSINVKTLTDVQIAQAVLYKAMTPVEGIQELVNSGYTQYDAWVLLCVYGKQVYPNKPASGPPPPQGAVIPGTT